MYKLECYVEDDKLGKVKRALASAGARDVTDKPLVNAQPDRKGGVRAVTANGSLPTLAIKEISKKWRVGSEITAGDIRGVVTKLGFAAASYSYVVKAARKEKLLKPTAVAGHFKVVKNG